MSVPSPKADCASRRADASASRRSDSSRTAHTLAAAASGGLDHDGKADVARRREKRRVGLVVPVVAGNDGHTGLRHEELRLVLEAHASDNLGFGTNECDAGLPAGSGERCALSEEAITWVDRACAAAGGSGKELADIEVRFSRRSSAQAHGFVGLSDVAGASIGIRIDGDGGDAHRATRAHDTASNLTPIGNEDFAEELSVAPRRFPIRYVV